MCRCLGAPDLKAGKGEPALACHSWKPKDGFLFQGQGGTSEGEDVWAQLLAIRLGGVPVVVLRGLMGLVLLQFLLSLRK